MASPQAAGRLAEVKFLTVAEVAALMRVSKMTVYRLVHTGELTAVRWAAHSGYLSTQYTNISGTRSPSRPNWPSTRRVGRAPARPR